jgi:hypothetical protein
MKASLLEVLFVITRMLIQPDASILLSSSDTRPRVKAFLYALRIDLRGRNVEKQTHKVDDAVS